MAVEFVRAARSWRDEKTSFSSLSVSLGDSTQFSWLTPELNQHESRINFLVGYVSFFLSFFFVAYEFLSADYKIWNTNGEALFAFPPPKAESLWWERARHFKQRFCINNNLFHTSTFCVNFRLTSMWLVRSFLRYNTTTIETTKNISGRFIQFSQYIKQLSHEVSRLEKSLSFRVSMNEQHWW